MPIDLVQLAGLAALSRDPDASARAREFLMQDALDRKRIEAQERLTQAQMQLSSSQFQQEQQRLTDTTLMGLEDSRAGREFTAGENKLDREQRAGIAKTELAQRQQSLDLQKSGQAAELGIAQQQLSLSKKQFASGVLDDMMKMTAATNKQYGTAVTPQEWLEVIGKDPAMGALLMQLGKDPQGKFEKGEMRPEQIQDLIRRGYLSYNEATQGYEVGANAKTLGIVDSYINAKMSLMDEETQAAFKSGLASMSAEAMIANDLPLPPDKQREYVIKLSNDVTTLAIEGNELSIADQHIFSKWWNQQPSDVKATAIDQVIAGAAAGVGIHYGLTPEQTAMVQENLAAALQAAADPANMDPPVAVRFDQYGPKEPLTAEGFGRKLGAKARQIPVFTGPAVVKGLKKAQDVQWGFYRGLAGMPEKSKAPAEAKPGLGAAAKGKVREIATTQTTKPTEPAIDHVKVSGSMRRLQELQDTAPAKLTPAMIQERDTLIQELGKAYDTAPIAVKALIALYGLRLDQFLDMIGNYTSPDLKKTDIGMRKKGQGAGATAEF